METIKFKNKELKYDVISDYLYYIKNCVVNTLTMNSKSVILTSFIIGMGYTWINNLAAVLAIHAFFLIAYFMLAFFDTLTGIAASMYMEKQKFNSAKFVKKILLVSFCLFTMLIAELLIIVFSNYSHTENIFLDGVLEIIVFFFHVIKISLMLGFIIYELTSLRENFVRLKLDSFVAIVDIVIYPLKKLNAFLDKKADQTLSNSIIKDEKE